MQIGELGREDAHDLAAGEHGDALGQAYKAMEGDISGVTVSLGVAFNSTFVALILSMIIMFCLHHLQLSQERLVLDCQRYADRRLLRFLVTP